MEPANLSTSEMIDRAIQIIQHDNPQNAVQVLYQAKAMLEQKRVEVEELANVLDEDDDGEAGEMVLHEEMMELQEDVAVEARVREAADSDDLPAPRQA